MTSLIKLGRRRKEVQKKSAKSKISKYKRKRENQYKFLSAPSQGHQAPHCIPICPLLANFPEDSFCSDLQQVVTAPTTQKH